MAKKNSRPTNSDKTQRVRDPIHDLIVFEGKSEFDQLAWRLLNTKEFQRLRRVKQLGFSELTYPGASHSRFSHSVGVFHTARQLVSIIRNKFSKTDDDRLVACLCAALLHDIGHGPFSHVFERQLKTPTLKKVHEKWTCNIISADTEVFRVLNEFDPKLPGRVVKIIESDDPEDIYASIVSSQFDADRLDYLRRDRYMCGVSVGQFDCSWLIENLIKADVVKYADPERRTSAKIEWIVLDPKAREAAEGYLLARYQLYSTVYYHKTTRSAEGMLHIVLGRVIEAIRAKKFDMIGLPERHSLSRFFLKKNPEVSDYINLDDSSLWSMLSLLTSSKDKLVADISQRILERRLFKAFDITSRIGTDGDRPETFLFELKAKLSEIGLVEGESFFEDRPRATGYDWYEWDAPSSLKKVLVRDIEQKQNIDIGQSPLVQALKTRNFLRVYAPDSGAINRIGQLWRSQGERR